MQMAVGFFDESTDEDGANLSYSVAGFLGPQDATAVLELRWKDILTKYGLPYFKASELSAGEGQLKRFRDEPLAKEWKRFSPRERQLLDRIKIDFTDAIVNSRGLYGIGVALSLPDLQRLRLEYKPAEKLPSPYFICASLMLMEAGQQMNLSNEHNLPGDRGFLQPIFDSHESYEGSAKATFDAFCKSNPISARYLLPPIYDPEERYLTLQAADNLAYEVRRMMTREIKREPKEERASLRRLKESDSLLRIYKLDYAGLKVIADAQLPDVMPISPAMHGSLQSLGPLILEESK
jgi:hypothetical protein